MRNCVESVDIYGEALNKKELAVYSGYLCVCVIQVTFSKIEKFKIGKIIIENKNRPILKTPEKVFHTYKTILRHCAFPPTTIS